MFDFGGSKTTVSVIEIDNTVFEVAAMEGNCTLGGKNCDEALSQHVLKHLKKKNKRNWISN